MLKVHFSIIHQFLASTAHAPEPNVPGQHDENIDKLSSPDEIRGPDGISLTHQRRPVCFFDINYNPV